MKKIFTLGEILIDFVSMNSSNQVYLKCPGGAPANVACGISRLGGKSGFIGGFGDDMFGHYLQEILESLNVDTKNVVFIKDYRTQLVFVSNDEKGERYFSFYVKEPADTKLSPEMITQEQMKDCDILHIGSISMIQEPVKSATIKAVEIVKANNGLISFDPNIRLNLWPTEEQMIQTITFMLPFVDILKVSEEELECITQIKDIQQAITSLDHYQIPLIIVSLGEKGSMAFINGQNTLIPSISITPVDTTGSGDAFIAGVLYKLSQMNQDIKEIPLTEIEVILRFANLCGAHTALDRGAIQSMPTLEDLEKYDVI
ncbi:MAG: carbohydrate kinase [Firmicutes bacterium HGW-Firmicutes-1]|jgi:fructokinase|nr:MAG: carbohydrate kinase [Firmicutes bacterium HGW-Firmicutes-1]